MPEIAKHVQLAFQHAGYGAWLVEAASPRYARLVLRLAGSGDELEVDLLKEAAEAGTPIPDGDVCVEFPSVLALVAAGRGAAIIPRLALGQALVTVLPLPTLGGRHIAAWYPGGQAQPTPAIVTVLDSLAQTGQAL